MKSDERDPVSLKAAARDYGVALKPDTSEVDPEATRRLRAAIFKS